MTDPADLKRPKLVATIWVALWSLATAYLCFALAMAWPYVNLYPQVPMVVTVPSLVFRAGDLAYMLFAGRQVRGWRRWVARLAALVAGFALMGALWTATDRISFQRFQAAFAPLVAQLHANAAAPCPPGAKAAVDAGLAAYYDSSNAPRVPANLRHDKGRFVLWLPGRSIDIDGSTVWYDSATRQWTKFHNDNEGARTAFDALVKPMAECKLDLR